jgi:hypothetical protein
MKVWDVPRRTCHTNQSFEMRARGGPGTLDSEWKKTLWMMVEEMKARMAEMARRDGDGMVDVSISKWAYVEERWRGSVAL